MDNTFRFKSHTHNQYDIYKYINLNIKLSQISSLKKYAFTRKTCFTTIQHLNSKSILILVCDKTFQKKL
jgi:hypothetical protein